MKLKKLSLRQRIFFAMIFLVIIASILIAAITIYQYNEEAKDYHNARLERKGNAINESINYVFRNTTFPIETKYIPLIFKNKISEIANINNLDFSFYDLNGKLLKSSLERLGQQRALQHLSKELISQLAISKNKKIILNKTTANNTYKSLYTYITDTKLKPIVILNIPYLENNAFQNKELIEFLKRLSMVYLLMFIVAIILAYFISKYITKSIQTVSDKMTRTRLYQRNEKIILKDASKEIYNLVNAYNEMIDELEENAIKLAKSEREHAWREMAKQVAHEIKNPLTPMRLTVQNFQRRFDKNDLDIDEIVNEFSKTIVQQIDVMSSIASAFSDFAKMPIPQRERLNIVNEVKLALDIFYEDFIDYTYEDKEIFAELDRTQLTRIITNLVTNAIQALKGQENPKIEVEVKSDDKNVIIAVKDNGKGVEEDDIDKIFEPKFTTKTSGMGLGLPIIKNIIEAYNGTLTFQSINNSKTIFTVTLPKVK